MEIESENPMTNNKKIAILMLYVVLPEMSLTVDELKE